MIQASLTFNSRPLDDLIGFIEGYAQVANEEFDAAFAVIEPQMLKELESEPGKPVYPIQWTSEKQRKAFWASDGFGKGIPYTRTGALAKAWQVNKSGGGLNIKVTVINPSSASPFVYGSLSLSNRGDHKQRFHSNTGWQTAGDTISFWLVALTETFLDNMRQRLGDVVGSTKTSRRAYTYTGRKA